MLLQYVIRFFFFKKFKYIPTTNFQIVTDFRLKIAIFILAGNLAIYFTYFQY